jgi:hypothetical protein
LYAVQITGGRHDHHPSPTTGALLIGSALAFAAAASVLSATFDWPDILR